MLSYVDEATGERLTLSASDLGAWSARTAGLLRDGLGLAPGARAAVLLPPHWQTAAVLLGAWSVGIAVDFRPWATAGLSDTAGDEPFDALFVSRDRQDSWLETMPEAWHRFVLGLAPDAAPADSVPDGYRDFIVEVQRYPAAAPAYQSIAAGGAASPDGTTYGQLAELAKGVADMIGLRSGDRLLVPATASEQPVKWLLAPLSVGASVVIVANAKPGSIDDLRAAESATHVLS